MIEGLLNRTIRSFEYLAATNNDAPTRAPEPNSFTSALIWALEEMGKDSTAKRLSIQELAKLIQKAPNFPKKQVPLAATWNVNATTLIIIDPLVLPDTRFLKFLPFGYAKNFRLYIVYIITCYIIAIWAFSVETS